MNNDHSCHYISGVLESILISDIIPIIILYGKSEIIYKNLTEGFSRFHRATYADSSNRKKTLQTMKQQLPSMIFFHCCNNLYTIE